jgi:hypothetical protein
VDPSVKSLNSLPSGDGPSYGYTPTEIIVPSVIRATK